MSYTQSTEGDSVRITAKHTVERPGYVPRHHARVVIYDLTGLYVPEEYVARHAERESAVAK